MTGPETIFGLKVATLVSSGIAAAISVALEWKSHSPVTAIGVFVAGVFVATVATDLTLSIVGVAENPGTWGYAIAATYGITGRNIILWLKQASKNPPKLISDFFGIGKDDGQNG